MIPSSVTAFCPGHISGYFKRLDGESIASTGSIGAGIVIEEGVTVTATSAPIKSVRIMRRKKDGTLREVATDSPPLFAAMSRFESSASVVTECRLPIGAGFGLSSAALLATLTALNQLFDSGISSHEIAGIAHETEVVFRTGLGDVAACQNGGRVVRSGAGIDGRIERYFDLDEPIFAVSFGPINTPSVLGSPEQMEQVRAAFPSEAPESVGDFFRLSREFAERSGLLTPKIHQVLIECNRAGIPASMTMLGNGIFAYGQDAGSLLGKFGETYEIHMAETGVRIVELL